MKNWSAYLKDTDSTELADMLAKFPTPAEYSKDTPRAFYLFVDTHPSPVNAIDATEYTTEQLINLLMTHSTDQGVLMTSDQATAVWNVLKPEVIEE